MRPFLFLCASASVLFAILCCYRIFSMNKVDYTTKLPISFSFTHDVLFIVFLISFLVSCNLYVAPLCYGEGRQRPIANHMIDKISRYH